MSDALIKLFESDELLPREKYDVARVLTFSALQRLSGMLPDGSSARPVFEILREHVMRLTKSANDMSQAREASND